MSAPKNIQRDGTWVDYKSIYSVFSSPTAITAVSTLMSGPSTLQIDQAQVNADFKVLENGNAGDIHTIGVYFAQPIQDNQPFRIKASVVNAVQASTVGIIVIGDGPGAPTGIDDVILSPRYIPFLNYYDDMIIINQVADTARTLAIGVGLIASVAWVNATLLANLSVQNLAVKPPTMQNAVS